MARTRFTKTLEMPDDGTIAELIGRNQISLDMLAWQIPATELLKLMRAINDLRSCRAAKGGIFSREKPDLIRTYECERRLTDTFGIACDWSDFRSGSAPANIESEGTLRVSSPDVFRNWIVSLRS